ncbi:MAG: hypothetical protein CMH27_01710 [Micavibrio sp.]|nr:hypothetical protein [Micavibrio sp.]|tara:strand:- start:1890 stop:4097 length:2208 start_codon:yes stop_codon:yes gene_type:complete
MSEQSSVSEEERTALEVGTVGWEASFINGRPDHKDLRRIAGIQGLSEEERVYLDQDIENLCAMIDDWAIWESDEKMAPPKVIDHMKSIGLFGLGVPKEYGGKGFSEQAHAAIIKKIASRSFAAGIIPMVINSLGPGKLVYEYGTQKQKDDILPKIASGEYLTCFGATEPNAGSDLFGGMASTGTLKKDNDGALYIHIDNLDKRYITLAPIANLLGVAYMLKDPDNYLGRNQVDVGMTFSLVPRDTKGLIVNKRLRPNGVPFPNGVIQGDVKLSPDGVIGGLETAGQHQRYLQECLAVGRGISLPSSATAALEVSSLAAGAFVGARTQFNRTLKDMEGLEEPLAKLAGFTYMAQAVSSIAAKTVDDGGMPTVSSAIAKNHLVAMMEEGVNDAERVLCGKGVMDGPSNPINRSIRAIPVAHAVEGAYYLTKHLIIGVQGLMRSHKHARHIFTALEEKNMAAMAGHAVPMVAETGYSWLKAMLPSWFHCGGFSDVDPQTRHFYRHINRMSKSMQMATNMSIMHLQKGLMARGRTAGRLGDVMSYMYIAACTLSEYEANGRQKDEHDLLQWSVRFCLYKAEEAFDDFLRNYPNRKTKKFKLADGAEDKVTTPNRILGEIMRASIFPFYQFRSRRWKPNDYLEHRVANTITRPCDIRATLTKDVYRPTDPAAETLAAFDDALEKWTKAAVIIRDVTQQKRDYTAEEQEIVTQARKAQARIVAVDEFEMDVKTLARPALQR